MLATYIRRMRNNNLEIRIASLSSAILISRLLLRIRGMYAFVWIFTKNEWNAQSAIYSCAFGPSITLILITRGLKRSDGAKAF